jgi:hypothetical protein
VTLSCDALIEQFSFLRIEKLAWKSSQTIIAKYHSGDAKPSSDQQQKLHERVSEVQSSVTWHYRFSSFLLSPLSQRHINAKNFSLHFSPAQLGDSGDYSCTVNDRTASDTIELVVLDVPEEPSRPLITSFTSRSVNLSWTQNQHPKNEPVTDFVLETR